MSTSTKPQQGFDQLGKMKAVVYKGKKDVEYIEKPIPLIKNPTDAIVKVTLSTICGSDLHLYNGEIPKNFLKDYTLGHESVGIVQEVGSNISNIKVGDRVCISAVISCGQCEFCQRGEMSCCDVTNKSETQKKFFGHNTGGIFGYSELMGGYEGCQAEYVLVPFADVNLFPIPSEVSDKKAICVADIACTGYHGTELANVKEGDDVVVFGCGPVGLMALMWSKWRRAKNVVGVDIDEQRLNFAKKHLQVQVINSKTDDPEKEILRIFPKGPNKIIDCVGFRFPETFIHKFERMVSMETDSPNILNHMITVCKKNGTITLIGDYVGYTNHFFIGALMEKHLTMNGGQLWPHRYQKMIFELMKSNKIDPSFVFTHTYPLSKAAEAYNMFDKHENGMIKPLLAPDNLNVSL